MERLTRTMFVACLMGGILAHPSTYSCQAADTNESAAAQSTVEIAKSQLRKYIAQEIKNANMGGKITFTADPVCPKGKIFICKDTNSGGTPNLSDFICGRSAALYGVIKRFTLSGTITQTVAGKRTTKKISDISQYAKAFPAKVADGT